MPKQTPKLKKLRILSLLPAATEIISLLGLSKNLVGIGHDSYYPKSVAGLPKVTSTIITNQMTSLEIDRAVKRSIHKGQSIFHIDKKIISKLSPNLIFTQELCPVCAPYLKDVKQIVKKIETDAKIVSFSPTTISDIFENIKTAGKIIGRLKKANKLIKNLKLRIKKVKDKTRSLKRPSVIIIEWIDPIMSSGHWTYEMVAVAGGRLFLSEKGGKSKRILWEDVLKLDPDILIIAPCGFDIKRSKKEIGIIKSKKGFKNLKAYKNKKIFYMDGDSYLTRPGPRIVDGIETLAKILHPKILKENTQKSTEKNKLRIPL